MDTSDPGPEPDVFSTRARALLVTVGLIMFVGGIILILIDVRWGIVVAILGSNPIFWAIQKVKIWPFRRRHPDPASQRTR